LEIGSKVESANSSNGLIFTNHTNKPCFLSPNSKLSPPSFKSDYT